ncbi:GFA family protein [Pleionea litopenaei]|uniref:CENP-V/GFA domain-containing protein n=1 Tax=Pleionea litopenaei TaxID=3070815 RepID=A0AA51X5Z3_9GAMM|nr:hypothetical protein [Pleionea sp. HL-JVS1]WMS85555.1 hypothetical protein Q9312_10050 [Pleionea sp. HL-JVS1]
MLELTCHCQNIQMVLPDKPLRLSECDCSMCRRYAAFWGLYAPDQITLSYHFAPQGYAAGKDRVFYHCMRCGCLTHFESSETAPEQLFAVNYRMANVSQWPSLIKSADVSFRHSLSQLSTREDIGDIRV